MKIKTVTVFMGAILLSAAGMTAVSAQSSSSSSASSESVSSSSSSSSASSQASDSSSSSSNLTSTAESVKKKLVDIQNKIREKEAELAQLQAEGIDISNQITYKETQIRITELQIEETINKIATLKEEIDDLEVKIGRLEAVWTDLSTVTEKRIAATYKSAKGGINPIWMIFKASDVSDYVSRYKYFKILQQHDKKLLKQVGATKDNYDKQRDLKAEKQAEAEALGAQLESQKSQLAVQKAELDVLLEENKQKQTTTLERIEVLKQEEQQIEQALKDIFAAIESGLVDGEDIAKGQVIGRQGNTGYVWPRPSGDCPECGSHLHFMILTCSDPSSCHIDPFDYLNKSDYHKVLEYTRPLPRSTTWPVTQLYGGASCSMYLSCFHSGVDLVDGSDLFGSESYGGHTTGYGAPIYAIADGEIFYGVDSAGGKYAIIKHTDDFYSAYWHLQ